MVERARHDITLEHIATDHIDIRSIRAIRPARHGGELMTARRRDPERRMPNAARCPKN